MERLNTWAGASAMASATSELGGTNKSGPALFWGGHEVKLS